MSVSSSYSPSKWPRLNKSLVIALAEWIPRKPGIALRNLLYPHVLRHLGNSVQIRRGVDFICAECIEIGDDVTINRNTTVNGFGKNNRILIGDKVRIDPNVSITSAGNNSKINLKEGVFIDRGVDIRALDSGNIEIGKSTYIGPYGCLAGPGSIKIGNNCLIASHTGIYANNHIFADATRKINDQGVRYEGIVIEDDCWLGDGVKVLDGVTIGRGSVIGAGAVVTKDIPPFSVAVGVPAKVTQQRKNMDEPLAEVGSFQMISQAST